METTFMKPINKDELYQNLKEFLKTKGVNLQDGSYSRGIQAGCSFLADAINLSQAGLNRAKTQLGKQLNHAREIIHEKTAPTSARKKAQPQGSKSSKARQARPKTGGKAHRRR